MPPKNKKTIIDEKLKEKEESYESSGAGNDDEDAESESYDDDAESHDDDQINTKKRYTCDPPCGSILVYTTDKHRNLILRCTSCQQKYKSSDHIISEIREGDESNTTLDLQRIVNNITIKVVDYDCKTCKKKTLAKFWREKSTYLSNYLCMTCEQFYTSLS